MDEEQEGLPLGMREGGVVNVMEPCPNYPMMATSGLDSTVKIWTPTQKPFLNDDEAVFTTRQRMMDN